MIRPPAASSPSWRRPTPAWPSTTVSSTRPPSASDRRRRNQAARGPQPRNRQRVLQAPGHVPPAGGDVQPVAGQQAGGVQGRALLVEQLEVGLAAEPGLAVDGVVPEVVVLDAAVWAMKTSSKSQCQPKPWVPPGVTNSCRCTSPGRSPGEVPGQPREAGVVPLAPTDDEAQTLRHQGPGPGQVARGRTRPGACRRRPPAGRERGCWPGCVQVLEREQGQRRPGRTGTGVARDPAEAPRSPPPAWDVATG